MRHDHAADKMSADALRRRLTGRFHANEFTVGYNRHGEIEIHWGEGPSIEIIESICREAAGDAVKLNMMRWQTCPVCGYMTAMPEGDGLFCNVCFKAYGERAMTG
jgi:hypothetical protein